MKDKLIRKIYPNLKNLDKSKKYLVGLSGGADSVVLLSILANLNFNIVAVHVHHNVRKESDYELEFCRNLANKLGIPFVSKKLKFLEGEKKTQKTYRIKRYDFFKEIYGKYNAEGLFLGQHLDDQFENLLSSFFKRKSVLSLKSMSTSSELMGMKIYRPLLTVRKHEILEMTERHNIGFVTDSSNFETDYERNKIRLILVPVIEKIFGNGIYKTLEEIIESSKGQNEINQFYSSKLLEKYFDNETFNLECLEEHSVNVLMYSIDEVLKKQDISIDKATFNDVKNVVSQRKSGTVNAKGAEIVISEKSITFKRLHDEVTKWAFIQ